MKIFGNREERDFNPQAGGSDAVFSAFPAHIISAANLSYTEYQALRNSDIFTAVTVIAKDFARLDIKIKENGIIKDKKGQLDNLINNRSNDIYSGYHLKLSTMLAALLTGVGYILIERANGQPQALYHIPTSHIQLKQNKQNGNYYYEINNNGKTDEVDYKDVIAIKPFTDDGLNPISILNSLKDDLDTSTYSKKFFANFFKNGTSAGGVLKLHNSRLNKEARDKIRTEFQNSNAGQNNSSSVMVLDEQMSYEKLEVSTDLLKLIMTNTATSRNIAKAYGLPLYKLSIESPNSSMQDLSNEYLFNTLSTYFKVWTSELNFKLFDRKYDYTKEFVVDSTNYRQVDWASYIETLLKELDKGAITLDEYRAATGRDAVPEGLGKGHRVDLNHVDLSISDDFQMRDISTNNASVDAVDTEASQGGENSNE